SLTFAPNVEDLRQKRLAAGEDPQIFAAKLQAIEDLTAAYNVAFAQTLAPYPNIHLVDLPTEVDRVKMGIVVGGEKLTVQKFGGLLSLDFLHFTNTGYALLANLVLAKVNEVLHLGVPLVDIEAVHAADPLSPAKLRAAGLLCVPP